MYKKYFGIIIIALFVLSIFGVIYTSLLIPKKPLDTKASAAETTSTCGWQAVQTPNVGNGTNFLYSIKSISNTAVWAVGSYFDNTSQLYKNLALKWDGQSWNIINVPNQNSGNNFLILVKALSPSDLWMVDNTYVNGSTNSVLLHGDGLTWTPVTLPNSTNLSINQVDAVSSNNIWIIGDQFVGQNPNAYLVHWDGNSWKQIDISSHPIMYQDIKVLSDSDIWIVGQKIVNNLRQPYSIHWNGNAWIDVTVPNGNLPETELGKVEGLNGNDVWADGLTYDTNQGIFRPFVIHWDGNNWTNRLFPNFGTYNTLVYDILPNSTNDVLVAGIYFPTDTSNKIYMMRWIGSGWKQESIANVGQSENVLWVLSTGTSPVASLSKPDIWAAGYKSDAFTQSQNFVEKYSCNKTLNVQVNPTSTQTPLSCTPKPICANPYDPRCLMIKNSTTNWCK